MMKCLLAPPCTLFVSLPLAIQVPRHPILLSQTCAGFGNQHLDEFEVPLFTAGVEHLVDLVVILLSGEAKVIWLESDMEKASDLPRTRFVSNRNFRK